MAFKPARKITRDMCAIYQLADLVGKQPVCAAKEFLNTCMKRHRCTPVFSRTISTKKRKISESNKRSGESRPAIIEHIDTPTCARVFEHRIKTMHVGTWGLWK